MKTKEVEEVKRQSSDTVLYLKPMYDDEPPDENVAEETHETVPATQNGEVSKEETIEALPTLGNTVTFEQEETTGGGNLVELENELKNIQMGIDAMEAFGDPFSAGGTTPDGTRSANKTPNPFEPADPFNMGGSSDFFSPQSDSSGFSSPPINQSSAMSSPSQDLFNPFQSQPGTTSTTTNLFAAQSVPQQQQQQQPIAYGQMGYGNMGQMGAPMGGNTMAAPMGGNPMIGTQMATNMALNAPTSYSMGSAMGGGYGGMSSHSQSYVPPPTQPVKPKADPFGDLDILGKSDSGVSDVFASLGARPARAPPPVPGKSTAAAPPVSTPRTNVGQQPPVDLFGSNMMTSPSGNDDFNLPSPDMPPPLPPRATPAAVNMSSELNNQPHVPPFVPPRLHGDNDLGIKDNVTHPIPIPSRIDNQHTNQQQPPQNRTETCESSGSAAAHFPNTFSLQESSASSNPSSLSSSACDSINNKTLSFSSCTTNSTSMTQSTQSTSLPINTLFDQHVLLSSSNPHADTNLSSSVPSACNNIANLFPQNDLFNTVTFTTAANTTNDVLLPVHEDPFADDPFTAESPTTSKIIVMDSSPVNHISSSSSSSSPPLSSSTGNPFVPAEGAVSKPDPFSVGGLTGGTSGSSNAFADQPFDAFDFGGGTAAPPSKTAPAQSSTFDNLDLFGGPAAEEPLYATVNKPKQ
uniref:Nuclear pore complex protein Nup153-like isoform X1 n=1 Tax=Saccoglossus kowalevskii TaxID=10224 RepID=A0ABM0MY06_SACKO|nr:PREDICTED: nuclear pore complex protein Nup153-like isoform X1 [Saccoglossus kowalevskii]